MNPTILESLDQLFAAAPDMKATGVEGAEIDQAQETLGVSFTSDYREFLARYGGAIVGPYPVYGLARAEPMDSRLWSVVDVTQHFRSQSWPRMDNCYVISMDHAGNPVGVDEQGKVVSFDHDAGEMVEIAENFGAYVLRCLAGT